MLEAGLVEPPFKPDVSTRMIYTSYDKENNTNRLLSLHVYCTWSIWILSLKQKYQSVNILHHKQPIKSIDRSKCRLTSQLSCCALTKK